jgi:hypothetical protein
MRAATSAGFTFSYAGAPPDPGSISERIAIGAETVPVAKTPRRLAVLDAFIARRSRPFHLEVRDRAGSLLSLAAGFIAGRSGYLVYQVNDGRRPADNLALTTRAHLAETMIGIGLDELVFPNGVGGVLGRACARHFGREIVLVRRGLWSKLRIAQWAADPRYRGPEHRAYRRLLGRQDTK